MEAGFKSNEEMKQQLVGTAYQLQEAMSNLMDEANPEIVRVSTARLVHYCYGMGYASGWWHDIETGQKKERNVGELISLIHSEYSEAMEGNRRSKPDAMIMDDKLPHYEMFVVELADGIIRIADMAGGLSLPLADVMPQVMDRIMFKPVQNVGQALADIHREISEAYFQYMTDKQQGAAYHLGRALMLTANMASQFDIPLAEALTEKFVFNATRDDHKPENRLAAGGKAY